MCHDDIDFDICNCVMYDTKTLHVIEIWSEEKEEYPIYV